MTKRNGVGVEVSPNGSRRGRVACTELVWRHRSIACGKSFARYISSPLLLSLPPRAILSVSRPLSRIHQRVSSLLRARRPLRFTEPNPTVSTTVNPELESVIRNNPRRRLQALLSMTTPLGAAESPAAEKIQDIPILKPSREIPTSFGCKPLLIKAWAQSQASHHGGPQTRNRVLSVKKDYSLVHHFSSPPTLPLRQGPMPPPNMAFEPPYPSSTSILRKDT
ncbi:hypothetical protein DL93DRAFT_2173537 [Clavulina sp. PMI_390]|nr:hypothetical protein DL93DRAFT_2173537 [Clavulina sp. PMI_390]